MKSMPKLQPLPASRKFVNVFGGYDHRPVIGSGSFYDMKNMSSDQYPCAAVRKARSAYEDIGGSPVQFATTLHHRDDFPVICDAFGGVSCGGHTLEGLLDLRFAVTAEVPDTLEPVSVDAHTYCRAFLITEETNREYIYDGQTGVWTDGGGWYGQMEDIGIVCTRTPQDRDEIRVTVVSGSGGEAEQVVSMGAWVVIFPEKVYFNAVKLASGDEMTEGQDYGSLEVHNEVTQAGGNTASLRLCDRDGNVYGVWDSEGNVDGITVSETPPANPDDGDYWLDSSEDSMPLSVYSSALTMWSPIPDKYVKISSVLNLTDGVRVGDFVSVDMTAPYNKDVQRELDKLKAAGYSEVTAIGEEPADGTTEKYMVLRADFSGLWLAGIVYGTVKIEVPQMNYIVECGNRLWGCYYGEKDGKHINEIYASKLGDYRSWNVFAGISTDSYVASRGADGKYTGAAVLGGNPLFFRENSFEKVFPSASGAHQITTVDFPGIQDGSWQSAAVIDGTLCYKGTDGIYAYTGSIPRLISEPLGETVYYDAVAAPLVRKYYISMRDGAGAWSLFVYDTAKGLWHKEDETRFFSACEYQNRLYYLGTETTGAMMIGGVDVCSNVEWMAESGNIGLLTPDQKRVTRIVLRLRLDAGAQARIFVQYNSGDNWIQKAKLVGDGLGTVTVPIIPIRCDHMKIKMTGIGGMELYSAAYTVEQGSDLP